MEKEKSKYLRSQLFFHLDGLALCGIVPVLDEQGILERSFISGGDVDELAGEYRANSGYLNVALRMLCSQGLLDSVRSEDKIHYRPAVGNDPNLWYRHSKAYAAGRSWMKEIVNQKICFGLNIFIHFVQICYKQTSFITSGACSNF